MFGQPPFLGLFAYSWHSDRGKLGQRATSLRAWIYDCFLAGPGGPYNASWAYAVVHVLVIYFWALSLAPAFVKRLALPAVSSLSPV